MVSKEKIGLGMYTVHKAVQENMAAAFYEIAQMGYRGIEFYGEPAGFDADEAVSAIKDSGLTVTGWHVEWDNLWEQTIENTVSHLHRTGCTTAVVPCLGGRWNVGHDSSQECRDRWLTYIEWMNKTSRMLQKEGLRLGYHNHEHEFLLRYDGKCVFDLLFENLAPEIVMELDSGNCIEGGADPLAVLQKYRDRQILLHLKPYSREKGFAVILGEEGDANDWETILHKLPVGLEWLLVESENNRLPEMENARHCLENLKKII